MYYEDEPEPTPEILAGSVISFTVNGVPQGGAFTDVMEGTYYPCASIYTMPEQGEGARLRANFGPSFAFPPSAAQSARPISEVVAGIHHSDNSKQPLDPVVAPSTKESIE